MQLDRKKVRVLKSNSDDVEKPVQLTPAEALSFTWELTKEVYSLSGKYDVESRLQRHVVSITRKGS